MAVTILGTSNCIVQGSFVASLKTSVTAEVRNLSIGASSSNVGLYLLDECRCQPADTVLLDYVINDTGYLSAGFKTAAEIKLQLGSIATAVRAAGAGLLVLILPNLGGLTTPAQGETVHLAFCQENQVPFLNIAAVFRAALRRGASREALLRDPSHMSSRTTPAIGRLVAESLARLRSLPQITRSVSTPSRRFRRVLAADLAGPERYVEHASSLRRAKFAVLRSGERMRLPVAESEALIGIMMNTGALGANVAFTTDRARIVKPMTIYWDAANPGWFTAIMVDFRAPLAGSDTGILMTVLDQDARPTEGTLHQCPSLAGRYGEVEVEGALIGSRDIETVVQEVAMPAGSLDLLAGFDMDALVTTLISE